MIAPTNAPVTNGTNARPKVLRRPQHFARKPSLEDPPATAEAAIPALVAEPLPLPARSAGRRAGDRAPEPAKEPHWQEDSRFGIALILLVAAINLILALSLPLMQKPRSHRGPATTYLSGAASMPAPIARTSAAGVTVYSEPQTGEARARMDLQALPEEYNDFSTSPDTVPAPRARSLRVSAEQ